MKFHWKIAATLILLFPLFFRLKYMFGAWKYSPLDSKDYIFWIIALASTVAVVLWEYRRKWQDSSKGWNLFGLIILGGSLVIMAGGLYKDINTLYLAGALAFIAGGCWLIWGWRILWFLLPTFFIAALGLPSTTYWTSFVFRSFINNNYGFEIKLAFAGAAVLWMIICMLFPKKLLFKPEPLFFVAGLVIFAFGYVQSSGPAPKGKPINLKIISEKNNWLGEELTLTKLDAIIRGRNQARRYVHFSQDGKQVGTLVVLLRNDLHGVHPAALCLSTAKWKVLSTEKELIKTKLGTLSANVIIAEKGGKRFVFFSWYTNDLFSTGSFIFFRKSWHYNETWKIYQITTPIMSTVENAKTTLIDFVNTFEAL